VPHEWDLGRADMITIVTISISASLLLQGLLLPILRRHVMDVPNGRSSHTVATPRGGGVAVTLAIFCGFVSASLAHRDVAWSFMAIVFGFAVLGLVEDGRGVGIFTRLGLQTVLGASAALWVFVHATSLKGFILATAVAAAAIWITSFVNAFNFMDGINGISALNALVAAGWFCYLGVQANLDGVTVAALAVGGAAAGFLPWNVPKARVFLGDAGSYVLGGSLAIISLTLLARGEPARWLVAPFLIYVADTGWTLARRIAGRRPWRAAHREHVYQQLVDAGWSHLQVTAISATAALGCCVILRADLGIAWGINAGLASVLVATYLALPRLLPIRTLVASSGPVYARVSGPRVSA
jgi:UDP-GlcNAc:undecaprenyl-phosphate GlcNAc-1-phosphate transferase